MSLSLDDAHQKYVTLRCIHSEGVFRVQLLEKRMSLKGLKEMHGLSALLADYEDIHVVVLSSKHEDFCHGMNLTDPELVASIAADQGREVAVLGGELIQRWSGLLPPTVCVLQGRAMGAGACLVWASDFRVARPGTEVCFPEIDRGMHLSWGIVPRLVSEVGVQWTRRLTVLGERVPVEDCPPRAFIVSEDWNQGASEDLIAGLQSKPIGALKSIQAVIKSAQSQSIDSEIDVEHFVRSIRDPEFMRRMTEWLNRARS